MKLDKKVQVIIGSVLLTFSSTSGFAALERAHPGAGDLIVKFKPQADRNFRSMNMLYQSIGVLNVKRMGGNLSDFEEIYLADDADLHEAVDAFSKNPSVEYVQPNYILSLPTKVAPAAGIPCIPGLNIPNCDPKACILPGIPFPPGCDAGAGPGGPGTPPATRPAVEPAPAEVDPPQEDPDLAKAWGILKVGAKDSWATFRGDKNFIVADIDTGTDYNHPDLAGNIWRNPNPVNGDVVGWDFIHNDGLPYDDQGHGTHTAGSIGAVGGNGIAISGVAQKVSIMTLKFLSAQGQGSTADAIKSIDYAVANGARVLSNSWGGKSNPLNPDAQKENKALYDSIERARTAGVLFVAAAGNDGKNNDKPNEASYPAAFDNDNILSVAATDENDKLAFFSNTGVVSTDLAAPGVNVYSTQPQARYQKASGTSMACPHVAGAAALLWARHPSWDYKKVKQVLMDTAQKQPSLQGKMVTGARLDILEALRSTE